MRHASAQRKPKADERPSSAAAQTLPATVAAIAARHERDEINDAQFAGLYFLHWQIALHGRAFASRRCIHDVRPDARAWLAASATVRGPALSNWLRDRLERFQFHGVSARVPTALRGWLSGRWPLELCSHVPSPREILRAQARGRRPVTAIAAGRCLFEPVLGKPNAFVFFQHDLEHAYQFLHSPALYRGQQAFFRALEAAVERKLFAPYAEDPIFAPKLHYLISDMNTHPRHARQYLRAILIEHHLRRSGKSPKAALDPSMRHAIERILRTVTTPAALPAGA